MRAKLNRSASLQSRSSRKVSLDTYLLSPSLLFNSQLINGFLHITECILVIPLNVTEHFGYGCNMLGRSKVGCFPVKKRKPQHEFALHSGLLRLEKAVPPICCMICAKCQLRSGLTIWLYRLLMITGYGLDICTSQYDQMIMVKGNKAREHSWWKPSVVIYTKHQISESK